MVRKISIIGVLLLVSLNVVDGANAIGGCSSRPNPTPNPDNTGYVECNTVHIACAQFCRALNRCYRTHNNNINACRNQQEELTNCRSLHTQSLPGSMPTRRRVVIQSGVCELRAITPAYLAAPPAIADINGSSVQTIPSSASSIEATDQCILSEINFTIDDFTGVANTASLGSRHYGSRNLKSLGITDKEKVTIAQKIGKKFNLQVSPRVARRMRSRDDVINCIQSALASAR